MKKEQTKFDKFIEYVPKISKVVLNEAFLKGVIIATVIVGAIKIIWKMVF